MLWWKAVDFWKLSACSCRCVLPCKGRKQRSVPTDRLSQVFTHTLDLMPVKSRQSSFHWIKIWISKGKNNFNRGILLISGEVWNLNQVILFIFDLLNWQARSGKQLNISLKTCACTLNTSGIWKKIPWKKKSTLFTLHSFQCSELAKTKAETANAPCSLLRVSPPSEKSQCLVFCLWCQSGATRGDIGEAQGNKV